MRISLSGLAGSGTTTVAEHISERTGYRILSAGEIFRGAAKSRGMSLADFGELAGKDTSIDVELDQRMMEEARVVEDIILEGRLAGRMCHKHGVEAFKVWVDADLDERARRVRERESKPLERVMAEIREREDGNRKRYMEIYGIDLLDASVYDLVVDSTDISAEVVAARVIEAAGLKG